MSSSIVTYTSVYTDSELGRVFWGADEEPSDGGPIRVIVYGYDLLPMQPVAPPSPDYTEYPKYLAPSDVEAPLEDQPLPANASPTALSPGYVADSDPDEDPKEDPEEDHTYYPADGDDEPSDDDDDDTDDEDKEPFKDEGDDEEEEEHLAPADSCAIPIVDLVPLAGDTEAFETDKTAPTPRSPQTKVPFAQTRPCRARKTVKLEPPMSASMEAHIAEHAATPTPQLPVASPPLPLPSPLTTSPTDAGAPLGYRAAGIWMRAASPPLLLPSTSYRTNIPEAEMPPRKRACLTTPAPGLEITESSATGAARQPGTTLEADLRRDRVMETGRRMRSPRDRPYHRHTAMILDREAMYARIAWTSSEDRSAAIEAYVRTLEAQKMSPRKRTTRVSPAITTTPTSTPVTDAQLRILIKRGVAVVLAERDVNRSRNGDDSHDLGTGGRRQTSIIRECTYTDFLKCQPMNFKGTEGVVRLTQWLEKMESVFHISNCIGLCTDIDIADAMPMESLKMMMTDKYCQGSGLPDMIHGSVKASKPKMMQEAIEFATELIDKKILTIAERQDENKRKFEDTSRNNQNQQHPFKRNNVA
ncbi:hypothetical protein Tco_1485446 [Tanacetum coccineum]